MEVDHDFVFVDEFDALAIEVKAPSKPGQFKTSSPKPSSPTKTTSAPTPLPSPPLSTSGAKPAAAAAAAAAKALSLSSASSAAAKPVKSAATLPRSAKPICDSWPNPGKFPAKEHAQKVARELGVQSGLIFLPGQEEKLYEYSDMGPAFRQRRHFYYLSGAENPGCSVTYDVARDILILWVPYADPKTALWFGTVPSIDDYKAITAVDDVRLIAGLERFFSRALTPGSTLYVLEPDQAPKLTNTKGVVHIDTTKLRPAIDAARVVKTDYEVTMIRRANLVSSAGHKAILSRLKRLSNEREIEAIFRGFCIAQGAKYQAYPVIAGSGTNASCLHYVDNNQMLADNQLVVLDAACEWHCYASDVTRTMPIHGTFSPEAQAIYSIVERMQEECIARIKPGVVFYTLHLHACIVAVTELLRLGILHNGTASEIFNKGTVAAFFPHGLGHHVGLEVHDVSGYEKLIVGSATAGGAGAGIQKSGSRKVGPSSKREWMSPEMLSIMYRDTVTVRPPYKSRQKLEKNMIVTIEPGIYFSRDYIKAYFLDNPLHAKYINTKVLEKYYPVGGVRIEDDILVTETGYENLTTAPKGAEMLKIINS